MAAAAILYIDDNRSEIELLRMLMERRDVEVQGVQSAQKGITAYDAERHRLVVIDWNIAGTQGHEVAKALLAIDRYCPIMLISGAFKEDQLAAAQELGIATLEKDMDMRYVAQICDIALKHTKAA